LLFATEGELMRLPLTDDTQTRTADEGDVAFILRRTREIAIEGFLGLLVMLAVFTALGLGFVALGLINKLMLLILGGITEGDY
jgi:hypothetical protein